MEAALHMAHLACVYCRYVTELVAKSSHFDMKTNDKHQSKLCMQRRLERLRVRSDRKRTALVSRPSQGIAAVCDLVTPDRARGS